MVDDYRKRRKTAGPDAPLLGMSSREGNGLGDFDDDQWSAEDDDERGGSSYDRTIRTRGWTRAVALLVAIAFLLPLAISAVRLVLR